MCAGILCLLSVCSCAGNEHDEGMVDSNGRVTVTLSFKARDVQAGEDVGAPENQLSTIRVYVFDRNGQDVSLLGYHHAEIQENKSTYNFDMELNMTKDNMGETCWFYIIANEGSAKGLYLPGSSGFSFPEANQDENGIWSFTDGETISPEGLRDLRFNGLPEYGDDGGILPMAAEVSQKITSMHQQCKFELQRSVAKLSLFFVKTGSGELYMDRGMYLYNIPEEGFLFPRTDLESSGLRIGNHETNLDQEEGPDDNHQRGGLELLEPAYNAGTTTPSHTNEITKTFPLGGENPDRPDPKNYELLPEKPIYMFAHYTGTADKTGKGDPNKDKGYYVKFLFHMHESNDGEGGSGEYPDHDGEIHRVFLPKVDANDDIRIFSRIYMKGYIELQLHWAVGRWTDGGGGNIDFN